MWNPLHRIDERGYFYIHMFDNKVFNTLEIFIFEIHLSRMWNGNRIAVIRNAFEMERQSLLHHPAHLFERLTA